MSVVFGTLPRVSIVIALYCAVIIMFGSFGPFIFNLSAVHTDDDYNQQYFSTFGEALWSVFTSITSSSFPNQVGTHCIYASDLIASVFLHSTLLT